MKNTLFLTNNQLVSYIVYLLLCLLPFGNFSFAQSSSDSGKYEGKYKNGLRDGKGTCTWKDGSKYIGSWKDGAMHGRGVFTYSSYKYDGQWKFGKKEGRGVLTYPDGSEYSGEFKNDQFHGTGTFTFSDGSKHEGQFKKGKSNGQGTHTWTSGTQYVGEWKDDMMHGQGILVYFDGRVEQGTFKENKYVPCECKEELTLQEEYKNADGVFVGTVTNVYRESGTFDNVFFEVDQFWKGEVGDGRTIIVVAKYTSCDNIFYEGEQYLVFANTGSSGLYTTSKCSRTNDLVLATSDVQELSKIAECKGTPTKDPFIYANTVDYVCGCDGNTYRNTYKADEAGVKSWRKGKCEAQ